MHTDITLAALEQGVKDRQNVVLSPLSLRLVLAMLVRTTSPEECRWIERRFGRMDGGAVLRVQGLPLGISNSVWYQPGETEPTQQYRTALKQFRTEPQALDFGNRRVAAAEINSHTDRATDGMVRQIVTERMLDNALVVLLNTVLLRAQWAVPFPVENTFGGMFGDHLSPVQYMHNSIQLPYAETELFQSVKIPRSDGGYVQIVLPRGSLSEVLGVYNAPRVEYAEKEVLLTMPKVSLGSTIDCGAQTGIEMLSLPGLGIHREVSIQLQQAARVEWNEEGVRAAAATAAVASRAMPRSVSMWVNQPFLFHVVERGGTASFTGVVYRP